MAYICGIVLLTVFIVGAAHRSRIDDSGHGELMHQSSYAEPWSSQRAELTTFGLQSLAELAEVKQSHGSAAPRLLQFVAAPFNNPRTASHSMPVALSPFPKPVTSRRHQLVGSNMNLKVRPIH